MTSTPKPRKWSHRTTVLARFALFLLVAPYFVWRHWYVCGGWRTLKAGWLTAMECAAHNGWLAPVVIIRNKIRLVLARYGVNKMRARS